MKRVLAICFCVLMCCGISGCVTSPHSDASYGDNTPSTTTQVTTQVVTQETTQATTEVTTQATTQVTTKATTKATTQATTQVTTKATTQATTKATTQVTTQVTTQATTKATTKPRPTTVPSPTVPTTTKKESSWQIRYYVDQFDDYTTDWYVQNLFFGTFSNSATTRSDLEVKVLFDAGYCTFFLYEYGDQQVKNANSTAKWYGVNLKDEEGNIYYGLGEFYAAGDRLLLSDDTHEALRQFMSNGEMVSVNVEEIDGMSSYVFKIYTEDFFDVLKEVA